MLTQSCREIGTFSENSEPHILLDRCVGQRARSTCLPFALRTTVLQVHWPEYEVSTNFFIGKVVDIGLLGLWPLLKAAILGMVVDIGLLGFWLLPQAAILGMVVDIGLLGFWLLPEAAILGMVVDIGLLGFWLLPKVAILGKVMD